MRVLALLGLAVLGCAHAGQPTSYPQAALQCIPPTLPESVSDVVECIRSGLDPLECTRDGIKAIANYMSCMKQLHDQGQHPPGDPFDVAEQKKAAQ